MPRVGEFQRFREPSTNWICGGSGQFLTSGRFHSAALRQGAKLLNEFVRNDGVPEGAEG